MMLKDLKLEKNVGDECPFQLHHPKLVGGFNPFEKYARQTGNLPLDRGENIKKMKPPPEDGWSNASMKTPKMVW